MVYGFSRQEAIAHGQALAFRVIAVCLEPGESVPEMANGFAVTA